MGQASPPHPTDAGGWVLTTSPSSTHAGEKVEVEVEHRPASSLPFPGQDALIRTRHGVGVSGGSGRLANASKTLTNSPKCRLVCVFIAVPQLQSARIALLHSLDKLQPDRLGLITYGAS